jgi:two-component system LytT family sensor kinase
MHGPATTDASLAGELIGFSAGLVITVLLLVLTFRAARLPGTPFANILLAICGFVFNLGGLAHGIALACGTMREDRPALFAAAIQFSAAVAWPIPILAIWRQFAVAPWQRLGARLLLAIACGTAALIVPALWWSAASGGLPAFLSLKEFTAYNGALLAAAGTVVLLRGRTVSRAVLLSWLAALVGVCVATLSVAIHHTVDLPPQLDAALMIAAQQSVLLVPLGTFFLFARFRFADLFIRHSLRIVLATVAATVVILSIQAPVVAHLAGRTAFPQATQLVAAMALTSVCLLSFTFVDRRIGALVNQWIFHAPDYRRAIGQLEETLGHVHAEGDIVAAVEQAIRQTLDIEDMRIIATGALPASQWPAEIADGDIVERDSTDLLRALFRVPRVELLVPIRSRGQSTHVLAIAPGVDRRGLVTQDVAWLRAVASRVGNRLDALRLERESIERQSREALLLQQVTEAELRALRAQINPHFLFNSLNTLADLIVTDPVRAETMTLRLATVFRHVLAHSARPLTSIREEMEFLRAYLHIEEARFGDRLQVDIDVAPEIALESIPSLILQPLVENALKHGLSRKPGRGRLWISARAHGDSICLQVEDDGAGPAAGLPYPRVASSGLGLSNVAERLSALYHDRARVNLEPRAAGGSRATVTVPRGQGVD